MDERKRHALEQKRIVEKRKHREAQARLGFQAFIESLEKLRIKYEFAYYVYREDATARSEAAKWFAREVPQLPGSYATLDLDKMKDGRKASLQYGRRDQVQKLFNVIAEENSISPDAIVTLLFAPIEFTLKFGDFLKTVEAYESCKADEGIVAVCPTEGWCLIANRKGEIFFGRLK